MLLSSVRWGVPPQFFILDAIVRRYRSMPMTNVTTVKHRLNCGFFTDLFVFVSIKISNLWHQFSWKMFHMIFQSESSFQTQFQKTWGLMLPQCATFSFKEAVALIKPEMAAWRWRVCMLVPVKQSGSQTFSGAWYFRRKKKFTSHMPEILSIINNKKCLIFLLKDFSGSHVNIFLVKILTPYRSHPSECVCVPDNVRKRPVWICVCNWVNGTYNRKGTV